MHIIKNVESKTAFLHISYHAFNNEHYTMLNPALNQKEMCYNQCRNSTFSKSTYFIRLLMDVLQDDALAKESPTFQI